MPERKGISSCRQKAGTMPDIHDFALSKMLKRMKAAGYRSYAEAEKDLLNNGGFAPTQMDAQNSIQRKRMGAVRLPSDSVKRK